MTKLVVCVCVCVCKVNRTAVRQPRLDVKDLVELTEYVFRVTAENDAGLGKPSDPSDVVIPRDPFSKPSPPGQPTIDEVLESVAFRLE